MKHMPSLMAALLLVGCATARLSPATVRTDGLARLGEATRVGSLIVTPQSVVEDSRCPINVQCVWEGRLRLNVVVNMRGGSEELRTELTLGEPIALSEGSLALVSAAPAKSAGSSPAPPASLFGFELR